MLVEKSGHFIQFHTTPNAAAVVLVGMKMGLFLKLKDREINTNDDRGLLRTRLSVKASSRAHMGNATR